MYSVSIYSQQYVKKKYVSHTVLKRTMSRDFRPLLVDDPNTLYLGPLLKGLNNNATFFFSRRHRVQSSI